jgi:hypothetical protein
MTNILIDLYDSTNPFSLMNLAGCFAWHKTGQDPVIERLVAKLLHKTRGDYYGSVCLHTLIAHWREISSAPLHSNHLENKWLSLDGKN